MKDSELQWWRPSEKLSRIRIMADIGGEALHFWHKDGRFESRMCEGEECELCAGGLRACQRRLFTVLDRSDGRMKMFSSGPILAQQIEEAIKNAPCHVRHRSRFDLAIQRQGALRFARFAVTACPPQRLRESEWREAMDTLAHMLAQLRKEQGRG